MRIINIFSFILSVLAFSTSLANTELAANNDLSPIINSTVLNRNQTILYGDKFKVDRINFSGLIVSELIASNIDQNKSTRFAKKNTYSTFCVPKLALYVVSNLNEWATANIGLNFAPSPGHCSACGYGGKNDPSRFNKYDKIDEAHIVFANQDFSPYFAKVGIQYVNYGQYSPNTIPATLTQLLTQIQAPGVTVGYTPPENGLNFSVLLTKSKKGQHQKSVISELRLVT